MMVIINGHKLETLSVSNKILFIGRNMVYAIAPHKPMSTRNVPLVILSTSFVKITTEPINEHAKIPVKIT